MTTVKQLIEQLQELHNPDEAIVFQYKVAEHTRYSEEEFAEISDYLMNNDSFADESADFFNAWIVEADDVLETVKEQESN